MSKREQLTECDYYEFRHYQKIMRQVPAGRPGDKPRCCAECPYHQPRWKFRTCTFSRCPYGILKSVFRRHPLKRDVISEKAVRKT